MEFKDTFYIFKTNLIDFLDHWFGFESIDDHTSIIMVLLTVTHVNSLLIMINEPVYTSCFDYFGAFTLIEIIAILLWSMTLLGLYFCHRFDATHSQIVLQCVHYLHFAGIIWFPILATQWFMCIKTITIPRLLGNKPAMVLNYAPSTLNGCLSSSTNCYTTYLFNHVEILTMFTTIGVSFSLYIFIMRKMDEYTMSQYDDKIVTVRRARRTRNRIRSSASRLSLSDSLYQLFTDSINESPQRPRMNRNSSSSDEQTPLNMRGSNSSVKEQNTVTLVRKENKATMRSQNFEFEVHPPKIFETEV